MASDSAVFALIRDVCFQKSSSHCLKIKMRLLSRGSVRVEVFAIELKLSKWRAFVLTSVSVQKLLRDVFSVQFTGALQVLGDFIEGVDERTQFAVLCAVRNLSDAATNEDNLGPLIVRLIGVVTAGEETSTACAAGVLSNLTCNNVRNKQTLCANRCHLYTSSSAEQC